MLCNAPSFLLPSLSPFIYVIWHLSSVRHREKWNKSEGRGWRVGGHKGSEIASCSCSLHVSIGDPPMSGRDNIMGPEAMQLPASVFPLLSRKSFSNFVPILTDENFLHCLLFLISISFNYSLSTMLFIQLSATLSAKWFKMQRHAGKTMSTNGELGAASSFFLCSAVHFLRVSLLKF